MPRVFLLSLLLLAAAARPMWLVGVSAWGGSVMTDPVACGDPSDPVADADSSCCAGRVPERCPCQAAPVAPEPVEPEPMAPAATDHWRTFTSLAVRVVVGELPGAPRRVTAAVRATARSRLCEHDPQSFQCVRTT